MKQTFSSNQATINSKVPSNVDSVVMSFQKTVNENTVKYDNQAMEVPDGLDSVEFQFNNSVEGVKYIIEDQDEMLERFINAFGNTGHNDVYRSSKEAKFGVGLNFVVMRNLQSNTFNTIINTSGVNNNNKYNIYLYFQTSVTL